MNKTNIVLAAVAVVCGVGCVTLFMNLNAERDRVQALEVQVVQLQNDLQALPPPISDTATPPTIEPPAQEEVAAKPAQAVATSTSPTPAASKPASAESDDFRALMADPAYRKTRLADYRLRLQRQGYSQVVAELGLSEDEADRFLDLLAEQALRENEAAIEKQPGDNPQQRWRQQRQQAEKEIQAFLGEERFRTWSEYMNSATARQFVSNLRTELATSSSPLREEQIKPLVKALAAEHVREWAARWENHDRGAQWTDETPLSERLAYMDRRQALIMESLDRQQEAGAMNLDSIQQRELNRMLDQRREAARVDLAQERAYLEAEDKRRRSR